MVFLADNFSDAQYDAACRADLCSFLKNYHSSDIVVERGAVYLRNSVVNGRRDTRKDPHSSVVVDPRYHSGYYRASRGEHGGNIQLLTRYLGYSTVDAVLALAGEAGSYCHALPIQDNDVIKKDPLPPVFPEPAEGRYRQLFAFLKGRGIPAATIQGLIDRKLLYQSKEKNNAVFINYERDWAELRGTYTLGAKQFRGMVANCRTDGFWWFRSGKDPQVAYICEAAIDAISLYLLHMKHNHRDAAYYISIGGVAKQPAIDRIKRNTKAILAVDNDRAGQECRDRNSDLDSIIPVGKDWNDDLRDDRYYDGT